ncbi:glycosyltransferase [Kineococcus gynurae]|uniref:Glycosyltransferase n=1 Tax=Kineococcus gynurae TaxID=452979 RepID=A0ABV5LUC2_9ACTN
MALTTHSLLNLRALARPALEPPPVREKVSVLVPARDEAARLTECLESLLDQVDVADYEVLVLDDASTDATAAIARGVAARDGRVRVLGGDGPPPGWLGKPHACAQLADAADGAVYVFVDADVRLAPHALAAGIDLLRRQGLDLVSPYPRQLSRTWAERLVQPLLQWSWVTTLPLRRAATSSRPSLSAANGQFLIVDAAAYDRAGGHAAVRTEVLEDLALLRAVKRSGGSGGVADGTELATCRMYENFAELRAGYAKSLHTAFGPAPAAVAVAAGLAVTYVVPAVAALGGSRVGLLGYAAGVVGRYAVAERTQARSLPDSLAHPLSIALLLALLADSWRGRGRHRWKGRALT